MWPNYPDICLTVEEKSWKNVNQEIDPTGYEPWPAAMVYSFSDKIRGEKISEEARCGCENDILTDFREVP